MVKIISDFFSGATSTIGDEFRYICIDLIKSNVL